ncbi:MAG: hypothetical protein ABIE70_04340 [bacterium]
MPELISVVPTVIGCTGALAAVGATAWHGLRPISVGNEGRMEILKNEESIIYAFSGEATASLQEPWFRRAASKPRLKIVSMMGPRVHCRPSKYRAIFNTNDGSLKNEDEIMDVHPATAFAGKRGSNCSVFIRDVRLLSERHVMIGGSGLVYLEKPHFEGRPNGGYLLRHQDRIRQALLDQFEELVGNRELNRQIRDSQDLIEETKKTVSGKNTLNPWGFRFAPQDNFIRY